MGKYLEGGRCGFCAHEVKTTEIGFRQLGWAVLKEAIRDFREGMPTVKEEARTFFFGDPVSLEMWCDAAGIGSETLIHRLQRAAGDSHAEPAKRMALAKA